jgi:hypothetical protein
MLRITLGIFVVLHGLVHLLYAGHSARLFELQASMAWPDGAWAFSGVLENATLRILASSGCALAGAVFVAGGAGLLARQIWSRPVVVGAAAFSTVLFALFWDGALRNLNDKGLIALLINAALAAVVLILRLPRF